MKILHVIPSVSTVHGGPSFAMALMERALAGAEVEITVATTDDDGPGKHLEVPLGKQKTTGPRDHATTRPVQANDNGRVTRHYFRKQTEFYKVSVPLWQWLRAHIKNYDVVHIHALFSFTSVAAARCARAQGVPYVIRPLGVLNRYGITKRRPALKTLSFRFLEKSILHHAAAIHYTSQQEQLEAESLFDEKKAESRKQKVESLFERRKEKGERRKSDLRPPTSDLRPLASTPRRASAFQDVSVSAFPNSSPLPASVVIPLGLDLAPLQKLPGPEEFLKAWPVATGRKIILFLSRLDPIKGLDRLIDSFATVNRSHPETLLVIAGDGEESFVRELKKRAESLGLANEIIWTGFLRGSEKLAALAAAQIFVLPSSSESFGIAAVEALAAGVPTVITTGVGIADDVRQNDAGLVVEPSPAGIASAIERLLTDSELSRRVSANGARLAQERYSLEAMGAALKALYGEVLSYKRVIR